MLSAHVCGVGICRESYGQPCYHFKFGVLVSPDRIVRRTCDSCIATHQNICYPRPKQFVGCLAEHREKRVSTLICIAVTRTLWLDRTDGNSLASMTIMAMAFHGISPISDNGGQWNSVVRSDGVTFEFSVQSVGWSLAAYKENFSPLSVADREFRTMMENSPNWIIGRQWNVCAASH